MTDHKYPPKVYNPSIITFVPVGSEGSYLFLNHYSPIRCSERDMLEPALIRIFSPEMSARYPNDCVYSTRWISEED